MSGITVGGQVGPRFLQDGVKEEVRLSKDASLIVQDGHARYLEAVIRGTVYSVTLTSTTLGANHASTTAATATPFVGIYNPSTSKYKAVILETIFGASASGASAVNEGVAVWQYVNPVACTVTSATAPLSLNTFTAAGSAVIGLVNSQALTGNTQAWALLKPFVGSGPRTAAPTASININAVAREETAGLIVVPPGTAVGLFVLATGTAINATASLVWEEVLV